MSENSENKCVVYLGTYTKGTSKGIYSYDLDLQSGILHSGQVAAETVNPSFLAIHPNSRFLYAVNEVDSYRGERSGAVSAFSIDPMTNKLQLINEESTKGTFPCYISIDSAERHLMVANYGSGSVGVLPIRSDGSLGEMTGFSQHQGSSANKDRQAGPHAHCIIPDLKSEEWILSADLGMDKILSYRLETETGRLALKEESTISVEEGAGPRHIVGHPNGRFFYVVNELDSTVIVLKRSNSTNLTEMQAVSTLPPGFGGSNTGGDIRVHPSGEFLYVSNRGHNSLAIYEIDEHSGELEKLGYSFTEGDSPRSFAIDPTGRFLIVANQKSNLIVVFRVDEATGSLETCSKVTLPTPVYITFLPEA